MIDNCIQQFVLGVVSLVNIVGAITELELHCFLRSCFSLFFFILQVNLLHGAYGKLVLNTEALGFVAEEQYKLW